MTDAPEKSVVSGAATRLHHPFSPSKLQYLEVSPHWTGEANSESEASLAGTAQHDAAEDHTDIDDPRLEDHQAEAVAMCKGYRDQIIAKYPGGSVLKEVYLPVDGATVLDDAGNSFPGTTGGYVDLAVISADRKIAEIADWKFGLWSVEPAENNLQGIAYLLGLFYKFPSLEEITVHFVMPHREEIDFHTFKREQFPALLLRVRTVVARARAARSNPAPDGTVQAGKCSVTVSSCLWCGNLGKCVPAATFSLKVGHKYSPALVPANVQPSLMSDPAKAKQTMEISQLMAAWAKAVRAQITLKAIEEDVWLPEGYVLRSRADNEVVDPVKIMDAARKLGVSDKDIEAARSIKMTPLNKSVSDLSPRGEKKAAVEKFREDLLASGALVKEAPIYFLERLKT